MERGYRGVEGILMRSVRYWTLLEEPGGGDDTGTGMNAAAG